MPHAKALRAIGQSLESIGVVAFVMEKNGRNYIVRSDSLPEISELSHKQSLSEKVWDSAVSARKATHLIRDDGTLQYDPAYVSWLDAQGRKKRRKRLSAQATGTMNSLSSCALSADTLTGSSPTRSLFPGPAIP
jgi:hypothetical protein